MLSQNPNPTQTFVPVANSDLHLQLYSPSRSLRLVDTPSLLEEVKQNVEGYGKLLLPSLADMEDLAPDSGAICQKVPDLNPHTSLPRCPDETCT